MSEKTLLVIADVYNLSRIGKKFTDKIEQAQIKHKGHLVDRSYADEINNNWQITGKKFVIDEEASIEAQEVREAKAAVRLENDEARKTASAAVAAMALGANRANPVQDAVGSMAHSVKELKEMDNLKDMTDEQLDEFFKTETRATGKALLGELITGNN